jgi:hypothetical protein
MTKCFVILEFGKPFPWMSKFIEHVSKIEHGWHWMVFTPNKHESSKNVDIVPMTIEKFNTLVKRKTGVKSAIFITKKGIPNFHITDFMVGYGKIFEDYLKEFDFWGMMGGPDIVFGKLNNFLPDSYLRNCDIFTDDPEAINGCFTLFRNREDINVLFKQIPYWEEAFSQGSCTGCMGIDEHSLYGTDEYALTDVMKTSTLRYKHPKYYGLHGHDRLKNHNIELKDDGSLWELNKDINPPDWNYVRPYIGREIMYYHFSQSKKWPL